MLAGHLIARQLAAEGIEVAFCVPGESYLEVIDGLADLERPRLITCRHEAAAMNMAVAAGRLSGRPGVCLVSRGPGAMHAAIGVHIARQDSVPAVLFVGQVPRAHRGLESFQELDYGQVFGSVAKWVAEIDDPDRVVELTSRAFRVARSGRPGPVVLALPEDVMGASTSAEPVPPAPAALEDATGAAIRAAELLAGASRPLIIGGGTGWSESASEDLRSLVESAQIPVVAGFRSQDLMDNRSPSYVGALGVGSPPSVAAAVREADLLLAVGTRLDEMTTGRYELIPPRGPRPPLALVHPDPDEVTGIFAPEAPLVADPARFVAELRRLEVPPRPGWEDWTGRLRQGYASSRQSPPVEPVDLPAIVRHVSDALPDSGTITNGAGAYTAPVHRYHQFKQFGTQLAPIAGAMGFGVPAAVAAKALHPERHAVCYAGDGCFLMSGQELATAVAHALPIIVIVVNDSTYGSIRAHQERRFPGRAFATDLVNPDFVSLAEAFGADGARVTTTAEFAPAFARALESKAPFLIEVRMEFSAAS